jgi:hypothetical protein
MSETVEFKISYDGDALREHTMDVRDLAPALLSLGQLFEESNRVLNDTKVSVKLQIRAHEAGSFEISFQLIQSIASQLSNFLNNDFVTSAINLKELILMGSGGFGGLYFLVKKLKGKRPEKISPSNTKGMVTIKHEGISFEVPSELLKLYQDVAVRTAIQKTLQPLQKEGVDVFQIKEDKTVIERIEKKDYEYFIVPTIENEKITETEQTVAFSIVSLAFKEENKWRLWDGSNTLNVLIRDNEFLGKVENNNISFSKGDILICQLKTIQWQTPEGLKMEHEIIKVVEHKTAAQQLKLFGD